MTLWHECIEYQNTNVQSAFEDGLSPLDLVNPSTLLDNAVPTCASNDWFKFQPPVSRSVSMFVANTGKLSFDYYP